MAENQVVLTRKILQKVIAFLKDSPWKNEYLPTVEHLDTHLEDQCVLAIGGRVKAGKSSLINALLSEDLAKVGITATTATPIAIYCRMVLRRRSARRFSA